eukprot:TRINITY_DN13320_c0_g1_i1.p1 TRINITY_DN13320_c0_g1~~TRINITY_DN13320_c0_g1_i1.p1  ORF type:complete len:286 (+),score=43.59 TRINITY_DN13320_c0_g1_i1:122-979(+)
MQETGKCWSGREFAVDPEEACACQTFKSSGDELLKSMPTMPSETFGPDASSDEELDAGIDKDRPGLHFFGEDGWDCAAGGGHDEAHGLGRCGSMKRKDSAEVVVASIREALPLVERLTRESSASLDPDSRYPYEIPLEQMVDDLPKLCKDFASQGPKIVATLRKCMGERSNDHDALFRARVRTLYVEQRHGHIWGDEDPAGQLEELEAELADEVSERERKKIQGQITELQEEWSSYNNSSFERRDDVTVFIYKANAKQAVVRVRIAKRVYRECCCINPFNGLVEL